MLETWKAKQRNKERYMITIRKQSKLSDKSKTRHSAMLPTTNIKPLLIQSTDEKKAFETKKHWFRFKPDSIAFSQTSLSTKSNYWAQIFVKKVSMKLKLSSLEITTTHVICIRKAAVVTDTMCVNHSIYIWQVAYPRTCKSQHTELCVIILWIIVQFSM